MKVAYLLGSLNRGGTETLLLDCFRNRQDAAYEMICIHRKTGNLLADIKSTGISLYQLRPQSILDFGYFVRLRKLLKKDNINIVHAQQPLDALLAWYTCLGSGIKILLTFHDFNISKHIINSFLIRFIIRRMHMNIFVSEAQKTDFEKRFHIKKWRLKVVHNGIAFEKFDMLSYTSVRDEFAIPGNNLVFICVGNFTSGRDQMTICRFLKILKMNEPGFRLIFAGTQSDSEPHLYDECVTYCKDNDLNENVIFAGLRDDVPSLLKQCDAFIYATNHDTFGIAVIEAIAAGIPVLVNDWEVMLEITENGRRAILYRTKDETDLLDKFLGYLAKKSWFNEQAKENAAWARKQYSIQHHMSDLYKVYNHLQ